MVGTLADPAGPSLRARTDSLERAAFVDHNGLYDHIAVLQFTCLVRILGFPVGNRTLDKFLEWSGCRLLGIPQDIHCAVHLNASHDVSHKTHLARRRRLIVQFSYSCLLLYLFQPLGHKSFTSSHNYNFILNYNYLRLPEWPLKVLVGANSPSLCPTMFSVTYTGINLFPL